MRSLTNIENVKLDDSLISARVATPLVLMSCFLLVINFLTGQTFTKNPYLLAFAVAAISLFSLSHFIPQLKFTKIHSFYITTYHIIFALIIVFIAPVLSYYLVLWILLAYLAEFYFQKKGLILSLSLILISLVAGIAYQDPPLSVNSALEILPWFFLISGVILILSRLLLGTRKSREEMAAKITLSEFDHERLMSLINSMNEAVIAVSESGKIIIYNSSALELLDTNSDITGKNISDILKLSDPDHTDIDILDIANTVKYILKKSDLYLELSPKNRIALEISISRTSQNTHGSNKNGYTFIIRDITRQKKIDEEKDDFISVVSHELRTPIAVAEANTAMAQLVAKKPKLDPNEILESLDKAHRQIMFLSEMVNDLSTLSRADRKDKEMAIETFGIADVLSELELAYKPLAEKKKLDYVSKVEDGLPNITTSRLYLKEILQNLISNAIKYTETGSINIAVRKNSDKKIHIAVHDTGLGISLAEQENVFDKFWRSEDVLTRSTEGTGLGLYIASRLAKRINSQIELTSKTGSGSTFELIIAPLATQEVDSSTVVTNEVDNLLS